MLGPTAELRAGHFAWSIEVVRDESGEGGVGIMKGLAALTKDWEWCF